MDLTITRITFDMKNGFTEQPEVIAGTHIYCISENRGGKESSVFLTEDGRKKYNGEEVLQARGSLPDIERANPVFFGNDPDRAAPAYQRPATAPAP